ncbi:inositol-pentakisphosphate 2-kinase [Battus philenor]|uniref:inositol-pentakisphosphate 2-kinase n=1 Tax=Battus philenor TaxID=42288 RepID=UPI0035CF59AA
MSVRLSPWKYINEGNVHIVLQIMDSTCVLRMIKEDNCKVLKPAVYESVKFVNSVMIPLIFFDKRYQEEVVEISQNDIDEMTEKLSKFRPKNRIFKSILSSTAIKAPNLTIISPNTDNYCIEIKPKEGYLAKGLKMSSKCYYCLKQFLKFKDKQISCPSNYCPLDLFSGDKSRMKYALQSLIENPQNNFRIFKNGVLIYDENENLHKKTINSILSQMEIFSNLNLFLDFIIDILLSDCKSDINVIETSKTSMRYKNKECIDSDSQKNNSFLNNLLFLQKLSEKFDYHTDYNNKDVNYVESILKEIETKNLNLCNKHHRDIFFTWDPFYLALISAIVKDCSIMISFTKTPVRQHPKVSLCGNEISYQLSITDLEPKMSKVLQKRRDMEKKLLELYAKIIASE